jgi:hypothetical protein
MISLQNSKRFKEELDEYEKVVTEISNETVRREAQGLVNKLKNEVKSIDVGHTELRNTNSLPDMIHDSRGKIVEIRKRLDTIVKDWKKTLKV